MTEKKRMSSGLEWGFFLLLFFLLFFFLCGWKRRGIKGGGRGDGTMPPHQPPPAARSRNAGGLGVGRGKGRNPASKKIINNKRTWGKKKKRPGKAIGIPGSGMGDPGRRAQLGAGCSGCWLLSPAWWHPPRDRLALGVTRSPLPPASAWGGGPTPPFPDWFHWC